jgi:hypothetical protein
VGGSDSDRLGDSTPSSPNDHGLERSEMKTSASMKTRNLVMTSAPENAANAANLSGADRLVRKE